MITALLAAAALSGGGLIATADPASAHAGHTCNGNFVNNFACESHYDGTNRTRYVYVAYTVDGVGYYSGYVSVHYVGGSQYHLVVCDLTGADQRSLVLRIHTDRSLDYRDPDGGGGRCGGYQIYYPWTGFSAGLVTHNGNPHDDHTTQTYGRP